MSDVFFQAVGSGVPILGPNRIHTKAIVGRHFPGRLGKAVCEAIDDSPLISGLGGRPYTPGYQESRSGAAEDRRTLGG
jgi:hypothetical protein